MEKAFSNYKSMGNFLDAQGQLTHPRFYACPRYLQAKKKESDQKQPRKGGDIVFPIISQWGLSVAMETRVFIQSAPKLYAAFPPLQ